MMPHGYHVVFSDEARGFGQNFKNKIVKLTILTQLIANIFHIYGVLLFFNKPNCR